ncbi:tryptophan--tRNA ligase, partial [Thermococci archaeon]
DKKLMERYHACKNGELTCGECKRYLIQKVQEFLKEHQKKRKKAEKLVEKFKYTGKLAQEQWNKAIPEPLRK